MTSRETRRWIIPKGWPMKGKKPWEAAAQEALEEAGVIGRISKKPIGCYAYFKRRETHFDACDVDVYLLAVEKQVKTWRERGERKLQWFTLEEAAELVDETGMAAILRDLAARGAYPSIREAARKRRHSPPTAGVLANARSRRGEWLPFIRGRGGAILELEGSSEPHDIRPRRA